MKSYILPLFRCTVSQTESHLNFATWSRGRNTSIGRKWNWKETEKKSTETNRWIEKKWTKRNQKRHKIDLFMSLDQFVFDDKQLKSAMIKVPRVGWCRRNFNRGREREKEMRDVILNGISTFGLSRDCTAIINNLRLSLIPSVLNVKFVVSNLNR